MRTVLRIAIFALVLSIPLAAWSSGLVPCDGVNCRACDFVKLVQNILTWFLNVISILMMLVFAFGGLKMVMAGGDTGQVTEARHMMTNVVVGLVIVLSAWLIIDTVMKTFVKEGTLFGPWNEIKCVEPVKYRTLAADEGRPTAVGTSATLTDAQINAKVAASAPYRSQLCALATQNGITQECDGLQALLSVESGGNPNAVSPVGAAGLMQLMPSTARGLDSSLKGLSDEEIRTKLKDPAYNMKLGTQYYDQLFTQYDGDLAKTYAAYNGGPAANQPSANCPGQLRWQCEWDDNAHTIPNKGYQETRNYVANVTAVRAKIKGGG